MNAPNGGQPGAHVGIDPTVTDRVEVHWECSNELQDASVMEAEQGVHTGPAVRLVGAAAFGLADAMLKILREAGFQAGLGFDMSQSSIWVKRLDDPPAS